MSISAEMKFSEAAASWLEMRDAGASRARYLKPRTIKTYRLELEALTLFFKNTRHCDVFVTNHPSSIADHCGDSWHTRLCVARASRADRQRASFDAISCILVDSGLMALTASW
jgi:hypothetical protein